MIDLIHSDNRNALSELFHRGVKAQLIYLDPPFRTGKTQVGPAGSYEDPVVDLDEFVGNIVDVSRDCWSVLDQCGSLVVHLDWHASPYVRVELDHLLGADRFTSEIIWRYRRWPTKTRNFQRVHDTLLRYVRDPKQCVWNQLYEPLAASTLRTFGTGKQSAVFTGQKAGKSEAIRLKSIATSEPSPGVPMGDVWDIGIVAPSAKERTGWPTQKPEALLERLILACTNPGDLALDPYCGSGVTLAVAKRIGRDAIGIDRNPQAIEVTQKRIGGSDVS